MNSRKGQLAVETMIIYGLVILVALTVIGGLLYFNILDVGSYLPDKCDLGGSADLSCEEVKLSSTGAGSFELGIQNNAQRPIESLSVTVTDETGVHFTTAVVGAGSIGGSAVSSSNVVASGDVALVTFNLTGQTIEPGKTLRGTIVTRYQFRDGVVQQEAAGTIRIRAS